MMFIIIGSLLIGIGRFLIPGHDLSWAGTYEAFAHIWIGYLLANFRSKVSWMALTLLTLLEIVKFAVR